MVDSAVRGADLTNQNNNSGDERRETVPCSASRKKTVMETRKKTEEARRVRGYECICFTRKKGRERQQSPGYCMLSMCSSVKSESLN